MSEETVKVKVDTGTGLLWCIGWLFTIGYAQLGFWKGFVALFVWPYFLAIAVR